MRVNGLDLNQLVTLEILLVECHLTRASERLCLTQPAISAALTKLREHFGDPLLIRSGREMRRSPFATELLGPLQKTLRQIHGIVAARPNFEPATAVRTFKIVTSDYIAAILMGRLITQVGSAAPHVRIEQLPICDENIGKFACGEADALIHPQHPHEISPFPDRALFSEHFVCIAATTNRAIGNLLTPEQFYAQPRVVPPYKKYWPDHYLSFGSASPGIPMPFTIIPLFVAGTNHIAIIPERLVHLFEQAVAIRRVELTKPIPSRQFTLRWHPAAVLDPFNSWMLDQIEASVQDQTRQPKVRVRVPASVDALPMVAAPH